MNIQEVIIGILLMVYVGVSLKNLITQTHSFWLKAFMVIFTGVHFSISLVFAVFLDRFSNINDPKDFYSLADNADNWGEVLGMGHDFMASVIYPFVKSGVGIELLFLIFATISYNAFLRYFKLIGIQRLEKTPILYLLFYLIPTIHVWTACLGKEPLLVWLMVVLLEVLKNNKENWKLFLVLSLIFLIRPHVCIVLLLVLLLLKFLESKISKAKKLQMIGFTILLIGITTLVFMRFFLKIEPLSIEGFWAYVDKFQGEISNKGGSAISVKGTNIASRVVYLLWMPLPFIYNITNVLQGLVAMENVYYVIVIFMMFYRCVREKWSLTSQPHIQFSIIAAISLIILFASYLYNLGLGNRMKLMFLPYLFYGWIQMNNQMPNQSSRI
ncbi:hypothetical protein AXE80_01125 [Wenyingzhuangia fucanilytica]|uniref:Glycosyltransferase RgtA/B/C/D-like domain-containing protein n=1 Tax=Wenyingzhuangia fucanilytica TaxID=1790137 RepID=A0A1B1Y2L7_9FLAO|nr:hypothetical protein [Wenyingzhuangia fucanilytica]ANW94977.1 hypothetical protein AXE80_01125 [Wenyingzhuangia fucanilytica]